MKLYTRTGDKGETGLYGSARVAKDHPRVAAYGTADELNSIIGMARAELARANAETLGELAETLEADLTYLQNALFDLGADLATRLGERAEANIVRMDAEDAAHLEAMIDRYQTAAPPLKHFVHPGGTPLAATLHLARTVARRAEREAVALSHLEDVGEGAVIYLNRLSDLLFGMARAVNNTAGEAEEAWKVGGRR